MLLVAEQSCLTQHSYRVISIAPPCTSQVPLQAPTPVHPGMPAIRFLTVASDDGHETDLMAALHEEPLCKDGTFVELMYLDVLHSADLLSGYFEAVYLMPPASTSSPLRHADIPGQSPMRSRADPWDFLMPMWMHGRKCAARASNSSSFCVLLRKHLHALRIAWELILIFAEDFGGLSINGPSSIWCVEQAFSANSPPVSNIATLIPCPCATSHKPLKGLD